MDSDVDSNLITSTPTAGGKADPRTRRKNPANGGEPPCCLTETHMFTRLQHSCVHTHARLPLSRVHTQLQDMEQTSGPWLLDTHWCRTSICSSTTKGRAKPQACGWNRRTARQCELPAMFADLSWLKVPDWCASVFPPQTQWRVMVSLQSPTESWLSRWMTSPAAPRAPPSWAPSSPPSSTSSLRQAKMVRHEL